MSAADASRPPTRGSATFRRLTGASRSPGAAAERVQVAQPGGGLDDLGEADLLAGQGQRGDRHQGTEATAPSPPCHGGRAEDGAERVGSTVTEHRALQTGPAAGASRRPRRWRHSAVPRDRAAPPRAHRARTTLSARPGRRSNRFTRFAAPATKAPDPATSSHHRAVGPASPRNRQRQRACRQTCGPDPDDLHHAGGDLAMTQCTDVAAKALAGAPLGEVVEQPDAAGAHAGQDAGRPDTAGQRRGPRRYRPRCRAPPPVLRAG